MQNDKDTVIRGGTVVDGTGAPPFAADVKFSGARITEIGVVDSTGCHEIDATNCLVTPGFVDIHTHYDGQAMWDNRLAPSSNHGVTTAVMGNCGVGFAPVRFQDHARLIELMEGVEDIPGAVMAEGLQWNWETFEEYLAVLAKGERDIDLCAQLAHGPLRLYVMGDRGARSEPATAEDIARMRKLAANAIRAGAFGFTTTRTVNHRTADGSHTPSVRAGSDELLGIAQGLQDAGRGVMELISDFDDGRLDSEFSMMEEIARQTGRPFSFSLGQRHHSPEQWRELLARIDAAQAKGLQIRAQVAPRPVGVLFSLQGSLNPFSDYPAYKAIAHKSFEERLAIFGDSAFRQRLLAEEPNENKPNQNGAYLSAFNLMYPLGEQPNYEPGPESSLAEQGRKRGVSPAEVAYELLIADEGKGFIFAPFSNYAHGNLDACEEMLRHPHTVPGLGDGGAHVTVIADASYPTTLLAHWSRDRQRGKLPIELVVKKQTKDTADAIGLTDRGVIQVGMKADLNVIDMRRLAAKKPYMMHDLPAGGRRLMQDAFGYVATIVSGVVISREGVQTGARPGRLVRSVAAG